MIARRYREMNRENWERVDKDIKTFSKRQNNLLYWAILSQRKQGRLANVALSIFAPVLTKRAGLLILPRQNDFEGDDVRAC